MEPDLGERSIDTSHDWKADNLDYTSYTIREYQEFVEINKSNSWHRRTTHPAEWYPLTKSQGQAMAIFDEFLKKPKLEVLHNPLKLLVLGQAGSGKSLLLSKMQHRLEDQGRKHFVAASTGVAANTVGGTTLHALFSIPFYKNKEWEALHEETKKSSTLYNRLIDLEILLIDEVSMCGGAFLQYINLQLQKIRDNKRDFGGVSVVLISDNTQLAPVMDVPLHRARETVNSSFAAAGIDLYKSFRQFVILKENVRQEHDSKFLNLLFNLRRKRIGEHDMSLLRSRMECNLNPDELADFQDSIRVFPKNSLVDAFNKRRLIQLNVPILKIFPKQTPKKPVVVKAEPLYIGKSVRVMLHRNLDIGRGLVNGSLGVVQAILFDNKKKPGRDLPSVIMVRFNNKGMRPTVENKCIPVAPITEYFLDRFTGKSFKIESFPLRVCYASTVHKIQGLTVDKISVNLDQKEWFENMTYTALSRVRNLKSLVLLDPAIHKERFENFSFLRGFVDQKNEFSRLGIFYEVMGEDEDDYSEWIDPEKEYANKKKMLFKTDIPESELSDLDKIDNNLTAVDEMRKVWYDSIKRAKLLNYSFSNADCARTSPDKEVLGILKENTSTNEAVGDDWLALKTEVITRDHIETSRIAD